MSICQIRKLRETVMTDIIFLVLISMACQMAPNDNIFARKPKEVLPNAVVWNEINNLFVCNKPENGRQRHAIMCN